MKKQIYEQFSRIGKALSNPIRLELIDLLSQAPRSVEALSIESKQSVANISQHLKTLKGARLVESRKKGLFVIYSLAGPEVAQFFKTFQNLAESRLTEVKNIAKEFLEKHQMYEAVDRHVLFNRIEAGEVTLIDVRPEDEFLSGHIPGSLSIPLKNLGEHLKDLPKNREVVAYCRGPYCVLSVEAVDLLRKNGFNATRMEESVHDWMAAGHTIQTEK